MSMIVADCDSMGTFITQTREQAFQTLGRSFGFLWQLLKLGRVFEKLGHLF